MKLSFLEAASEAPSRVALISDGKELTYSDLSGPVRQAMDRLRFTHAGRSPDRLTLVAQPTVSSITTLYAAMTLGVPVILIHPKQPLPAADEEWIESGRIPKETLAILSTSGTSGASRRVCLSRAAFIASAEASSANLGWRESDRWLVCIPFSHVGGLSILTRCLIARRTVVLASSDPARIAEAVSRDRVTLLSLIPTQLTQLLNLLPEWNPPPFVRAILLGGAPAARRLLNQAADRGWPILTTYGLTEACSQVTTQRYGTVNRGEQGSGEALPGYEVRIVDGIIQVRSPSLMSGHFAPEPLLNAFTRDGWLITQDCGEFDSMGRLHVLGRKDDVIITGGEKVHPSEVESSLNSCPGVSDACVFGVPDEKWGNIVGAAIEVSSTPPDDTTLLGYVARHLSSFERPRKIARLQAFPRGANGKVDRRAVIAQARELLTPLERR